MKYFSKIRLWLAVCAVFFTMASAAFAADPSLVIKLADGLAPADQAAVIARDGGTEISSIPALRLHVISVPANDLSQVFQQYQSDPQVLSVEQNKSRKAEGLPNDVNYGVQWGLSKIGWESVYGSVSPQGTATVALLDTGVDATHADLAGNLTAGTSILDGSNGRTDSNGHGTAMAGIVAALTGNSDGIAGVAFQGVRIMPVTVLNASGTGQDSDIISGIIYAADHGADVILMAFSNPDFSQNLQDAIDYAWSKGAVLVAATGNSGLSTATFPAGDRGVVGVSGTAEDDTLMPGSNTGLDVFLAAPGNNIYTTSPGNRYTYVTGTSASSAVVAGVAAFMKAVDPTLSNGVIVGRLAKSADAIGTTGDPNNQNLYGNGRVNLASALASTATGAVQPSGADPVGAGGPYLGPYTAAACTNQAVTVNGQTGTATYGTSQSVTFSVTFSGNGNCPAWTPSVSVMPYSDVTVQFSGNGNNRTLTITTTAADQAGSKNFTVSNGVSATGAGSLVIDKATPTLSVSNSSTFDGTAKSASLTSSVGGKISNLKYNGQQAAPTSAGTYAVTADFAPTDLTNYNSLTAASAGNFVIGQATPSLSVTDSPMPTYDGTAKTATVRGSAAGTVSDIKYNGSPTAPTAAGSYAITADFTSADANYGNLTGAAAGTFTIKKADATVTPAAASKTYGAADPALTGTLSGFIAADNVTATYSRAAGENVTGGPYAISATLAPPGVLGNYNITYNTANFTITKADETLIVPALPDMTYGDPPYSLNATASSGLPVELTIVSGPATISGNVITPAGAGVVTVKASQPGNGNFNKATDVIQTFNVLVPTPGVPTGGSVCGTFILTWNRSALPGVTYVLEYSNDGSTWTKAYSGLQNSMAFTQIPNGPYTFRVKAVSGEQSSIYAVGQGFTVIQDLSAPGAPYSSAPGSETTGTFTMTWGRSHLAGSTYILQYSNDGINWVQVYSGQNTWTSINQLPNGTYTFRVQAVNGNQTTEWVTGSTFTVAQDLSAPGVPIGSDAGGTFTLSWGPSHLASAGYVLEYSNNGTDWTTAYNGTDRFKYFTQIPNGSYTFRVKATNGDASSPYTYGAPFTVTQNLTPPGIPSATVAGSETTGTFTLSWTRSHLAGATYVVQYTKDGINWIQAYTGQDFWCSFSQLPNGPYTFRVRAFSGGQTTDWVTGFTFTVKQDLSAPGAPTGNDPSGTFTLSWGPSHLTLASYTLEYSTNGTDWTTAYTGPNRFMYFAQLPNGNYTFRVKAVNGADSSTYSTGATFTVHQDLSAPGVPYVSAPGSSTSGTFTLTWQRSHLAGATYVLDYSTDGKSWTNAYTGQNYWNSFTGLGNGQYTFRVKAMSGDQSSAYSSTALLVNH